ncbi:TIM-barrel domain-containing protein [Halobacillus sp. BBL2006]|uniref:TIM-barrel domain-containing protein n=1 Tax=Halobacillus sp. BBL2006 TaxID=1543706 RepID=UPI00068F03F2|nr:TIM-barrel domain-containing protein [Halobacillus sp. BBL2006]
MYSSRWKNSLYICSVFFIMILANTHVEARESSSTAKGSGPLYWISYEHQFTNNTYLPEDRWKQNIDWMAENFQPYGYDMMSTDGWIEGSTKHTENGYIISHNDSWEHGWKYWADYLESKGMNLGIYYNPLWVTPAAVNNENATVIGRPDIKIKDIVTEGDRFNGGQDTSLYWVDVTKDGAKEFVQGYVNFFKEQGSKFLRVDFLSWYETGTDKSIGEVGIAHGRENYETALRWMEEAAGDDMTLSLVMPHLKNHAELELKYGDIIRIDEDVFHGGWDHISGRRQEWTDTWSQWANPFQGFTGFADVSGRNSMILDGDFLRMNTFTGEFEEEEKKTAVSLFTLAGSPIAIADQFDTIGEDAHFYQNSELIELNQQGLAGKPIFYNNEHYKFSSRDSERWLGQLPDGAWVLGLFNRSDVRKELAVDFSKELGLETEAYVRDLWAHEDIGYRYNHKAYLTPHDTSMVKVVPRSANKKYETEVASYQQGAYFNNEQQGFNSFGYIENMDQPDASVTVAISVPTAGDYTLNFRYANGSDNSSTKTLVVNEQNQSVTFESTNGWDTWKGKQSTVQLEEGENLVTVKNSAGDEGELHLDYIELLHPEVFLTNGDFEMGDQTGWSVWNPDNAWTGVNKEDAHDGSKHYFYKSEPYQASIHQKIKGIENGEYKVSAWVKLQPYNDPTFESSGNIARMEVSEHGSDQINVDIKPEQPEFQWKEITQTFEVTSGELDIGFYTVAPGNTSFQIDDVKLEKVGETSSVDYLTNSTFEQGMDHWTTDSLPQTTILTENNSSFSRMKTKSEVWQYVTLPEGNYKVKAKARKNGVTTKSEIYVSYGGGKESKQISAEDWSALETSPISVEGNEVVKVGVLVDGDEESYLDLDDLDIVKAEVTTPQVTHLPALQSSNPYDEEGNGITFHTEDQAAVRLSFLNEGIARVWMEPTGTFSKKKSYVVDNETAKDLYSLTDEKDYYKITTREMTIRAYKNPFRLAYYDRQNKTLLTKDTPDGGLGYDQYKGVYQSFELSTDEHLYGLGMDRHTQELDKRGTTITMDNNMVGGHGGNTSDISGTFLASTNGYGVYFDNTYQNAQFDLGKAEESDYSFYAPNGEMVYYFMAGPDFSQVMNSYGELTGEPPLPPKWSLGYIQSKFGYKSWEEVEQIANTFRDKAIPMDGLILDVYWAKEDQYFDFTWSDAFANSEDHLKQLANKGVKVTPIVDPYIESTANNYKEAEDKGYFVQDTSDRTVTYPAWYGDGGLIDFTNEEAAKWYTQQAKSLYDNGTKGWWIDLNEPEQKLDPIRDHFRAGRADEIKNVYALLESRAFYEGQRSYTDERVWSLARSGFSGISEYGTTVWTGDIDASWEALTHNLQLGLTASMSGMPYFTTDAGGFSGEPSSELYTRWMQAAAYMPIFRSHGADGAREPWAFGEQSEAIVTQAIRQRYRLLPYIYSAVQDTTEKNLPLMRPLVFDYQKDSNVFNLEDQWMFGPSLLIAPVHKEGSSKRGVYLPDGNWYEWDGQEVYEGGQTISYGAPLAKIPVFVKEGSIIPLGEDIQYVGEKPNNLITLRIYPYQSGGLSTYTLYEDDGSTYKYEEGTFATTEITAEKQKDETLVTIGKRQGSYEGMVEKRTYTVELPFEESPKWIKVNGEKLESVKESDGIAKNNSFEYDEKQKTIQIKTKAKSDGELTIRVKHKGEK